MKRDAVNVPLRRAQPAALLLPLFFFTIFFQSVLVIQPFNSSTIPSSISDACASALTQDISGCSNFASVVYIAIQRYINDSTLDCLCSAPYYSDRLSYQSAVDSECGATPYELMGNVSQTIPSVVDPLVVSCYFPPNGCRHIEYHLPN